MKMRALIGTGIAALALGLGACVQGERVAGGTGTTAGNTITARVLTGRILTVDGNPAVKARINLRPESYLPGFITAKEGSSFGLSPDDGLETFTDSAGYFSLVADTGTTYMLECERFRARTSQVVWKNGIHFVGGATTLELGPIPLSQGSNLTGSLLPDNAGIWQSPDAELWVGFPGTDNFTRLDIDARFSLNAIPPGAHSLEILRLVAGKIRQRIVVSDWRMLPGSQAVMEPITLPPLTQSLNPDFPIAVGHVTAAACQDGVTSLRESEYSGSTGGGDGKVLRAMLMSNPPKWIELDPCLGTWRTIAILPAIAAKISGTFSGPDADFIAMGTADMALRIGRDGSVEQISVAPNLDLISADYHAGRFYGMTAGTSKFKIYADEGSLWNNVPVDSINLGVPVNTLKHAAILDNAAYFGVTSDTLHLYDFDFASASGNHTLATHTKSQLEGMATKSAAGGLWFLTARRELTPYDPVVGTLGQPLPIEADFPIRGLTRFHFDTALKAEWVPSITPASPTGQTP